jgi:IMP and pyridine-specific 5'-nucleotidase
MEVALEPVHMSSRLVHPLSMRRDEFVEWIKEMLFHSFVLGNHYESYVTTMRYIEELVKEHREKGNKSRLKTLVPTIDKFHTELHLVEALDMYNAKYSITNRRHVPPTFNEIRHILNLAQLLAINVHMKLVSFDGDQTLYSDGGNFEEKSGLSYQIIELVKAGVVVTVITAANYEHNGPLYGTCARALNE